MRPEVRHTGFNSSAGQGLTPVCGWVVALGAGSGLRVRR